MKQFHIGAIISIVDGRLVGKNRMNDVREILNYMTDDSLFTHQLLRAGTECAPILVNALGATIDFDQIKTSLDEVMKNSTDDNRGDKIGEWLEQQAELYGALHNVPKCTNYEAKDSLAELAEMIPPEKIIVATIE